MIEGVDSFICRTITVDFKVGFENVSSYIAGQEPVDYYLLLTPILSIPANSLMTVTFPIEITLAKTITKIQC